MKKLILGLSAILFLGACSQMNKLLHVPDTMDEMKQTTIEMKDKMTETNEGIHDQKILIPYKELLDSANGEVLSPIPFKMMAYGKKLGEAARADELVEVVYLHLKEINESYLPKRTDDKGDELPYSKEELAKINNEKLARYMALSVVVGFAKQATIEQVIQDQIVNGGRYEETAYQVLMLRFNFIRDVLLDNSLLSEPLSTLGKVTDAVRYMKQLDFIAGLPFANLIAVKTTGILAPSENINEKLDPKSVLPKWKSIRQKAELDCKIQKMSYTGNSDKDLALYSERVRKLQEAFQVIDSHIAQWSAKLQ